ncbi:hypothetical protein PMIN01_06136 [Paraphaeosphaeria minitans]|uniref:Uncharacterized protein n=1 Tax=Paraphaeosphaeria minitans TaxID=565426 RepID=A0A9P6GID9_9PLEO|nr:hypothetical protein PMIN01_06136 [Paraphaeosphaeria minitans]
MSLHQVELYVVQIRYYGAGVAHEAKGGKRTHIRERFPISTFRLAGFRAWFASGRIRLGADDQERKAVGSSVASSFPRLGSRLGEDWRMEQADKRHVPTVLMITPQLHDHESRLSAIRIVDRSARLACVSPASSCSHPPVPPQHAICPENRQSMTKTSDCGALFLDLADCSAWSAERGSSSDSGAHRVVASRNVSRRAPEHDAARCDAESHTLTANNADVIAHGSAGSGQDWGSSMVSTQTQTQARAWRADAT